MPFKTFSNWLFDNDINSPIPTEPNILKYDSPITATYMISIFMKCPKLNYYLNTHLNNINLRYIDKQELFLFIKSCVQKFGVKRYQLCYKNWNRKTKLFNIFKQKFPNLKNYEIQFVCDKIDNSKDKDKVYQSLGLEKPKRTKIKITKNKVSLNDFLNNFVIMELEG
jgi:hypothetical protein